MPSLPVGRDLIDAAAAMPGDLRDRVGVILGRPAATRADAPRPRPGAGASRGRTPLAVRLSRHEAAIDRLARTQADLSRQIALLRAQSDQTLPRLLRALRRLDRRSQTIATRAASVARAERVTRVRLVRQRQEMRAAAIDGRLERVSSVVHSTQRSAFGQTGSVFATNNLLLAGNELFWTFVGPTLRELGLISRTSATVAAIIAPVGALATGQLALGERQHERFVFGTATFEGEFSFRQSLRPFVAPGFFRTLQRGPDLDAQVTPIDRIPGRLSGRVESGVIVIRVEADSQPQPGSRVAWVVDLGPVLD